MLQRWISRAHIIIASYTLYDTDNNHTVAPVLHVSRGSTQSALATDATARDAWVSASCRVAAVERLFGRVHELVHVMRAGLAGLRNVKGTRDGEEYLPSIAGTDRLVWRERTRKRERDIEREIKRERETQV